MTERCEVKRCRTEASLTYLERGVCEKHWNQLTAEDAPPDALRIALRIEATAPTATEEPMAQATESSTKKSKKSKSKAVKEPKPKKEKAPKPPKEPQVVFAFRLREADRDLIHKAAGPGKATRFVLAAALAAASGDQKAFAALVDSRQK